MNFFKKYFYHPIKNLIAKLYIQVLRKFTGIKIIGVTGSAGKTTTKEMIAAILTLEAPTVWSKTNIDPVYNIPSTILRCTAKTKYLVLEMGVEYPGEMDYYLWLATPDVAVITNIFPTHTEFFGDADGVLKEKSKLVLALSESGVAVLNKNDSRLKELASKLQSKIVFFEGENENAAEVVGKLLGVNEENIKAGLKSYNKPRHRHEIIKHKSGAIIYDDSYNSNPEALLTTLRKFNNLAGKNTKIAVLGDMLELGKIAESEHLRVKKEISKHGFEKIFGIGNLVKLITPDVYENIDDLLPEIKKYLRPKTYILVKGSRSIGLDRLIDKLI